MKKQFLWACLPFFFFLIPINGYSQLYWNTNGSSASWTSSNWSTSGSAPFTTAWSNNSNVFFTANSSLTYVTSTPIGNITVSGSSTTVTFTSSGSLSTSGNIRTIDVCNGCLLNFNGQDIATSSGTGFIKTGNGTWDLSGQSSQFPAGFTLNSGTVIVSGNNSFGNGSMNINGGVIQSSATLTFSISSLTIGGNFTLSGTGNDVWGMGVSLGSTSRTITNSTSSGGNRTFSGIISGTSGTGLTFNGSGLSPIILSGANTYTGLTTVSGGKLQLNKSGGGTLPSTNNCTITSGTFQISSNQTLNDVTLSSGTLLVDNGVTLTINGNFSRASGTTITLTGTGAIQYGGSSTLTYNGVSSQTITASEFPSSGGPQNLVIDNAAGVTFPGSFNRTIGNLTLTSGTLADGGNTITVGGNISGNASHTGSGKILMTGSGKTISGATLQNIELNNSGGFSLTGAATINGTLTLTSGIFTSTPYTLTIGSSGAVSGDASTRFINGPMAKIGSSNFIFPIGKGSKYARIAVANLGGTNTFTAEYFNSAYTDLTVTGGLDHVSFVEYWNLDRSGSFAADVTLYYEDASFSGISSTSNSDLIVAHYNGTDWEDLASGTKFANSNTVTMAGVNTYSPFTFGGPNGNNPLPVTLINLQAKKINQTAQITWTTATELNNHYFSIERKNLSDNFELIGTVKGNGNSNSIIHYSFIDKTPNSNSTNFYRIVQHDFDGKSEAFGPVSVRFDNEVLFVNALPNPFENILTLNFDEELIIEKIVISDMLGKVIYEEILEDSQSVCINTETWKPGNYFITISGSGFIKTIRQVKL